MNDNIEDMIADGSVIPAGFNEEGEAVYTFTDKCKELHPRAWEAKYKEFLNNLSELWLLGYVEMDFADTLDGDSVMLTTKTIGDQSDVPSHLKSTLDAVLATAAEEYGG